MLSKCDTFSAGLAVVAAYLFGFFGGFVLGSARRPRIVGVVVAIAVLSLLAADASACGRCGLFGRRCRFAPSHHVQHVTHHQPHVNYVHQQPDVSNFVFNNVFPTPYLQADQGSSVFGYSVSSAAYRFDPNLAHDRSVRFQELALENAKAGNEGSVAIAQQALALEDSRERREVNLAIATAAISANSADAGGGVGSASIQSYRVTVQGGELQVEKIDVGQGGETGGPAVDPGPTVGDPPDQPPAGAVSLSCFGCHGGKNELATKAIRLEPLVAIDDADRERVNLSVLEGRMPPKSNFTEQQKAKLLAQLCKIPGK